jgi:hypothetical protein
MPIEINISSSNDCYLESFQDSCTKFCDNVLKKKIPHNILCMLFIKKIQDEVLYFLTFSLFTARRPIIK